MRKVFDHPFLGRGFRPFFFLGAVQATVSMALWALFLSGHDALPATLSDPVFWHAHEMVFGFTMAIVAGFLLTAVANWTGGAPTRQIHLAVLCLLWILGRAAFLMPFLPAPMILLMEGLFLPALAISLAIPLWRSRNMRNFIFLGLLSILWLCDMTAITFQSRAPLHLAILVIVTMITLIGGRVIPAFTVAALRRKGIAAFQHAQPKMDLAALISVLATLAALLIFGASSPVTGMAASAAAVTNALRLYHYKTIESLGDPMVWILHLGFAWMIIGFAMLGLSAFGAGSWSPALHALTAGAIGTMCIGMMCRVTLGHTGRDISAGRLTVLAFAAMQVGALSRVFGPLLWPMHSMESIMVSGIAWSATFALYLVAYMPILIAPRPDGTSA